jgi:hypothetical protein
MTAPAEKTHVSPESNVRRPVYLRVGLYRMAQKADGFAVHLPDITATSQHDMGVNRCILILAMTLRTYRSPVGIWAVPQKLGGSSVRWSTVDFMTGQTPHLPFIQGKGYQQVWGEKFEDGDFHCSHGSQGISMKGQYPEGKGRTRLWLFSPMAELTGTVGLSYRNRHGRKHDLLQVAGHQEGR